MNKFLNFTLPAILICHALTPKTLLAPEFDQNSTDSFVSALSQDRLQSPLSQHSFESERRPEESLRSFASEQQFESHDINQEQIRPSPKSLPKQDSSLHLQKTSEVLDIQHATPEQIQAIPVEQMRKFTKSQMQHLDISMLSNQQLYDLVNGTNFQVLRYVTEQKLKTLSPEQAEICLKNSAQGVLGAFNDYQRLILRKQAKLYKSPLTSLKKYLKDENFRYSRLQKPWVKTTIVKLSREEQMDLFNTLSKDYRIYNDHWWITTAKKEVALKENLNILQKNLKTFQELLPEYERLVLNQSKQGYIFEIVDMSKYDDSKTIQANTELIKYDQNLKISTPELEALIAQYLRATGKKFTSDVTPKSQPNPIPLAVNPTIPESPSTITVSPTVKQAPTEPPSLQKLERTSDYRDLEKKLTTNTQKYLFRRNIAFLSKSTSEFTDQDILQVSFDNAEQYQLPKQPSTFAAAWAKVKNKIGFGKNAKVDYAKTVINLALDDDSHSLRLIKNSELARDCKNLTPKQQLDILRSVQGQANAKYKEMIASHTAKLSAEQGPHAALELLNMQFQRSTAMFANRVKVLAQALQPMLPDTQQVITTVDRENYNFIINIIDFANFKYDPDKPMDENIETLLDLNKDDLIMPKHPETLIKFETELTQIISTKYTTPR